VDVGRVALAGECARIARLKDGRTRLAHKPEHAVDLDTGAVVAAERRTYEKITSVKTDPGKKT